MLMMIMTFHYRIKEYILLKQWVPQNETEYILSCLGVVTLGVIYELLRTARLILFQKDDVQEDVWTVYLNSLSDILIDGPFQVYQCNVEYVQPDYGTLVTSDCHCAPEKPFRPFSLNVLADKYHQYQSILHAVQEFLGLSLMMITMTYNTPIAASVAVGHIIGFFFLSPLFSAREQQRISQCCCN
uniref:Copper transport protein n=1 Tax=Bursaphelenchus xylophilus TaxID=6326 RepID=A0A1I7S4Z5_BURXY